MEEETQFCGNCKKDVASSNFSLHEVHCLRFLSVCPECGQSVPCKDMKQHQDESHRKVRCELCHQSIQQYLLEEHKAVECDERSVICHFCELDVAFCKLQEHVDTCGSRTQLCPDCKKYIMFRDLEDHTRSCPPSTAAPDKSVRKKDFSKNVRCPKCSTLLTESTYLRHQNECSPLFQFASNIPAMPRRRNADNIRPSSPVFQSWCEIRASLPGEKPSEEYDVKKDETREFSFGSRYLSPCTQESSLLLSDLLGLSSNRHYTNQHKELADPYDVLKACSRCNILLPTPTLKQHEQKCKVVVSLSNFEPL